jgi:major membrane immunogen (membrane-anchored lipoprotein)
MLVKYKLWMYTMKLPATNIKTWTTEFNDNGWKDFVKILVDCSFHGTSGDF